MQNTSSSLMAAIGKKERKREREEERKNKWIAKEKELMTKEEDMS